MIERVAADALALCAIAAPTGAEEERAQAVAERLAEAGAAPARDATGNVVARFGPAAGPAAIVAAGAQAIAAAGRAHGNVGVVGGGTSVNTIAAEATAEIDLRDADDAALEATRDRVVAALRAATPAGIELVIEPLGRRPAGSTPP